VAWGVALDWGALTPELGLELARFEADGEDEDEDEDAVDPEGWCVVAVLRVEGVDGVVADAARVAVPIPNDAPRAPTIPSPASPAWSRLLRWRGFMSSTVRPVPVPDL
jgi:hypothetical protein